jgi:hypothetical protein
LTSSSDARFEHELFEDEVRRIARQLWPAAQYSGATKIAGRERDMVLETEESVHLVEATTSRSKAKAEQDCRKLADAGHVFENRSREKGVRRWFVTRDEPTADQRGVAKRFGVTALSFAQFQSKLIDSRSYLAARDDYEFGSVRDPVSHSKNPTVDFIPLGMVDTNSQPVSLNDMLGGLHEGRRFVLLGDYGAGKSMTLRHLYQRLRREHLSGKTPKFPVFVNLRDHFGQRDPAELLERHARSVGFAAPAHLVRAWRSGYVHLLLDGFDETTALNIQGLWVKLQDNRYRAMEVVRALSREQPESAGLVLSGRAHFFDSPKERRNALGLNDRWREVSLNEFTDEQIRDYLEKRGVSGLIPNWLPSRPLLVAYLAGSGLLSELLNEEGADPAAGWDILLGSIASRESQIEAGIDGATIRRILERLATKARGRSLGLGPLNADALVESFREVCGYRPDERGMVLLQRLPGLGADPTEEGSRSFVDEDFADACRAGDVFHFAQSPFQFESQALGDIELPTGTLGVAVATRRARAAKLTGGQLNAALNRAREAAPQPLVADLVRVMLECRCDFTDAMNVFGVVIQELDLPASMGDASRLEFRDCYFSRIGIDTGVDHAGLPRFSNCFIDEIEGRTSRADLPTDHFSDDCIIESFTTAAATTAEVLGLQIPLGSRVILTILKKIFERRGSGRKESALRRGLDHRERQYVDGALQLIERERLAFRGRRGDETIWQPNRSAARRVGLMITAPTQSTDPLMKAAATLQP